MADISYVVVLTRGAQRAAAALRSIAAQQPDGELLLVLNEADEPMRELARAQAGARIVHDGADIGIPLAWNLGLREAACDHACIVHEDCELQPGCAARLLATMRERPDAGAVGPLQLATDRTVLDEGDIIWSDGATSRWTSHGDAEVFPSDYLPSSCLLLDRAAAIAAGGFDERFYPAMYVDAAIACALWQSGRTVLCDTRAINVHHTGAMVDAARGPRRGTRFRDFLLERNRARFQAAWPDLLAGQAQRANAGDAAQAQPAEIARAEARVRARERAVLAGEVSAGPPHGLRFAPDLDAHARVLRRELEDEFIAMLVDREAMLQSELVALHTTYAEQHAELRRVTRAYDEAHSELERLHRAYAEVHPELERVHRAYADLHPELVRVHRAYAELWEERDRLLQARQAGAAD